MSRYKAVTDLYFTEDGDYYLDSDSSDLEDTKLHAYRGFIQRIDTYIRSTKREWKQQPTVGANINEFRGRRNSAELGERIRSRVISELVQGGLVAPADLNVIIFPLGPGSLALILQVRPPDVPDKIILTYSYDLRENRVVPRNL